MKFKENERVKINSHFPNADHIGKEGTIVTATVWEIYYVRTDDMDPDGGGFKCYDHELDKL
jgi:hypothetical protein